MIKTLKNSFRLEKEPFKIPRSAQRSIPIKRIHKDGVWEVGKKFSKSWRFSDINYSVASEDDQKAMLMSYCGIINALSPGADVKITLNNHRLNRAEFQKALLMSRKGDGLDGYRGEYNRMLLEKAEHGNGITQERYITVSVAKKSAEEAKVFFMRVENELCASFGKLSSAVAGLDNNERLRVLHDFYRMGEESQFALDLGNLMRRGHDFKDIICPDSIRFKAGHFEMGGKVGRVLFLKDYASYIDDGMIVKLADFPRNLMLSIDILPVPTEEAVREMQKIILSVETDITRWQRKQNSNNNFSAVIPYGLDYMRGESRELLDDFTAHDQRMMFALVTIAHMADTVEELDSDTEALLSIGSEKRCNFAVMRYQQEDALNTALPFGLRPIEAVRTLTTSSTVSLMPFSVQEIHDAGGVYYGNNAVSRNILVCNRKLLLNGNGFILGISGSGKSFAAKGEIAFVALNTDDDILIVDPEREYSPLVRQLGGEVVTIAAGSESHINALDMSRGYGGNENPVMYKSEFIMSLCEQLMGAGQVSAKGKSIIDRCISNIYRDYLSGGKEAPPTLPDFRADLLRQPEQEAKDIALALELFTDGSLNVFAHESNIDMGSRIMLFDILDLGKQLKTVGMLVMLDAILNRVIENRKKGKRTWIYIDEIYLFFAHEYSSNFLSESWKRFRKYGALATGITQNVEDCLRSALARTMLSNSEFLLMLNQSPTDRMELARLLNISETQMSYITDAAAGRGLIKVGASLVPFVNEFPKETSLYKLMTTKPGEG